MQAQMQVQLLQQLLGLGAALAPATPSVPSQPAQKRDEGLLTALQSFIGTLMQSQQQQLLQQRQLEKQRQLEQERQAVEQQQQLLRLLCQLATPGLLLPTQLPQPTPLLQAAEPAEPLQAAVQLLLQGLAPNL